METNKRNLLRSTKGTSVSHPIIISRLIESGYQVFLPIDGGSELLIRSSDGIIQTCRAQTASIDVNRSSVLKTSEGFDVIAAFDPATRNVWVIPREVLEDRVAIRLGRKYDDYLIPEPRSKEWKERRRARGEYFDALRERAGEVAKEKGEQK